MKIPPSKTCGLVLLALSAAFIGCNKTEQQPLLEVEGVVLIDGKAAEGIRVSFMPDSRKGAKGPTSSGVSDSNGKFKLTTDTGKQGAVAGWHVVVLSDNKIPQLEQEEEKEPPTTRVPAKYSSLTKTDLFKEVKTGNTKFELAITTPPPEPKVDPKEPKEPKEPKVEPKNEGSPADSQVRSRRTANVAVARRD